uniref:Orf224 n=1 Tax=Zancudomyces culisetae TaxID=1213189 RepID=Q3T4C7_ZANCU|nr:orf224 [Zancudomyces culisetae]AAW49489.1 orf224 [Zancudomyces culisetae]
MKFICYFNSKIPILAFILPNFKAKNRIGPHNEDIISLLIGSLLGNCNGERLANGGVRFIFKQSIIHKKYLFWLFKFLNDRGFTNNNLPKIYKNILNNKIYEYYKFNTYSYSNLLWLYKLFYSNKKKRIPLNINEYLTPLALAIWIMDVGYWKDNNVIIATNSFTKDEINLLILTLKKKWDLNCSIHSFTKSKQHQLYIKVNSIFLLRSIVLPYFHKSMYYKLGL